MFSAVVFFLHAKKNDKDLKIEALEAQVKNLEEAKKTRKRWNSTPSKWQIAIVIGIVICLLGIAIYFYLEVKAAMDISTITESEFQRIATIVDGSRWKVAKNDFPLLREALNEKLTGFGYTSTADGTIDLELYGTDYGLWGSFFYDSGYITGFLKGSRTRLFFSESVLKLGRTLTLYIGEEKIVFYENE